MGDAEATRRKREKIAEVERRLDEGEWLKIGDLMVLFDASRSMVDRWLRNGVTIGGQRIVLGYQLLPGDIREVDPADVRRLLAERRKRRTADHPEGVADAETDRKV